MSIRASSWAWTVQTSPTSKLVLLALADFADEVGHCWPGLDRLTQMTGLSERTVRTALRALEAEQAIKTERAVGRGNTSRYALRINQMPEKGRELPVLDEGEKGRHLPEKGQLLPQKGQHLPEKGRELPPNRKEPPRTVREPPVAALSATNLVLPAWLPPSEWADWCAYRKGRTWTQKAAELSIANLDAMRSKGHDPAAVINQSIANGWRGLFPIKNQSRNAEKPRPWWLEDMISERH